MFLPHLNNLNFNSFKGLPNRRVDMLRRQDSGATLRESVLVETVIRTWWLNSQELIDMIFNGVESVNVLSEVVPQPTRQKKIHGTNVFGEKLYTITLTSGLNIVKHFLKLLVGSSDRGDVYTTIFLSAVNTRNEYGWYELFHISDHPGSSENVCGAIHLKTISNINTIIETIRTLPVHQTLVPSSSSASTSFDSTAPTPPVYGSFNYGPLTIRSAISPTECFAGIAVTCWSQEHTFLMDNKIGIETECIKIDLFATNSPRLYLVKWYGRIGYIVDQYLYDKMSYHRVLHDLGWIRY